LDTCGVLGDGALFHNCGRSVGTAARQVGVWETVALAYRLRDGFSEGGFQDESTARGMNGLSLGFFLGFRWSILNPALGAGFGLCQLRRSSLLGIALLSEDKC